MSIRHEIEKTLYSYAWGFDQEELDILAACFVDDAEFVIHGAAVQGREAIVERLGSMRAARREADERMRHVMTNVLVHEEDASAARVSSYFTSFLQTGPPEGTLRAFGTGYYMDNFVAEGDRWLLRRREVFFDRD